MNEDVVCITGRRGECGRDAAAASKSRDAFINNISGCGDPGDLIAHQAADIEGCAVCCGNLETRPAGDILRHPQLNTLQVASIVNCGNARISVQRRIGDCGHVVCRGAGSDSDNYGVSGNDT